jgi:polysaccharide pyruvyl transferase WcaK-like protein
MPSALVAGSVEPGDPGGAAAIEAMRRSLPEWDVTMAGGGDGTALAGVRATLRADATILTGGVFGAPESALLRWPRAMLGVSAGAIRGARARAFTRMLVRRVGLMVLRDEESADALAAAGAQPPFRVGADPAWAEVGEPETGAPSAAADGIAVATEPRARDGFPERLALALAPMARAGMSVRLLPWCLPGHERPALDTARDAARLIEGGAEVVEPPRNLHDARRALEGSQAVLGFRHHALVAAAGAGVPFVAAGGEPGIAALARRLGQVAVGPDASAPELTAAFSAALGRPAPGAAAVRAQIDSANEGLRLLRLLLSGGRSEDADQVTGLPLEPAPRA